MFKFKDKEDFKRLAKQVQSKHDLMVDTASNFSWVVEAMEKAYTQGLEDAVRIHKFKGE